MENLLREFIRNILVEYVVPKGYSLERWKAYKKKTGLSNKDFSKKNPGKKWKVVHGKKRGQVGEPIKGMDDMSYEKATKAHTAIKLS